MGYYLKIQGNGVPKHAMTWKSFENTTLSVSSQLQLHAKCKQQVIYILSDYIDMKCP